MKKVTKAQLRQIRELLREKEARDKSGVFAAEGSKVVKDIAVKGYEIKAAFVSRVFAETADNQALLSRLDKRGVPVYRLGESEFNKISSLRHPEGVLILVKKNVPLREIPSDRESAFIVLCDGVQDPGNLGTIIRTSAALGADYLMFTGESVDVYNPKVVRSSSGMVLETPVLACSYGELDRLKKKGYYILASVAGSGDAVDIGRIEDLPPLCILAFGSEGKGISEEISRRADTFFYIPLSGNVESINVASAVAISLYVFSKRRKING